MPYDAQQALRRAVVALHGIARDLEHAPDPDEDTRAYEHRVAERIRAIAGALQAIVEAGTASETSAPRQEQTQLDRQRAALRAIEAEALAGLDACNALGAQADIATTHHYIAILELLRHLEESEDETG